MARDARVVLIGIDDYPSTPAELPLSGPADDAVRFARFFRDAGVPPERITLLLGTAEPGPDTVAGMTVRPADRRTIREVLLTELPAATEEQLYVLWGGHGYVDVDRNRRLRYPDAGPAEPVDLDLDSLLRTYVSDLVKGLDRQIWLIDACQIHQDPRGHEKFPAGNPAPGRTQDVLFAAGIGQPAANLRVRRTGVFSREVLRLLETSGLDSLAETQAFAAALSERFVTMRADGLTDQIPTYLRHRDVLGNESVVQTRSSGARLSKPGLADLKPPVMALTEVREWNQTRSRDAIVALLPGRIPSLIPHMPNPHQDAIATVQTCARHRGGLAALVEAVGFFGSDEAAVERFAEAAIRLARTVGDH